MQSKGNYSRQQRIFVGIDVHLKSWDVTCLSEGGFRKSFTQSPSAKALSAYLRKNFPRCEYHAVYESGFTGFSTYYALQNEGINAYIINAADVPTSQKDEVMKTDRRDSAKLACALKNNEFKPVHVLDRDIIDDRNVVRASKSLRRDEGKVKTQIRHLLHNNGVEIPERFQKYWTCEFTRWLREDAILLGETKTALLIRLNHLEAIHGQVLAADREVRKLIRSGKYASQVKRLMAIPGIGQTMAIVLLTEIGDFSVFSNQRRFASYLGLIPTCDDSGPKKVTGEKTFRGNSHIGAMLIESCWKLVANDPAASSYFFELTKKMKKNVAIVKVARRLSNIILSMMKNEMDYDPEKAFK